MGTPIRNLCSFLPVLLIRSPEYIALVQKTQTLDKEELHTLSKQYDAVYFHPVRGSIHTHSPRFMSVCLPRCIHTQICPPAGVFLFMLYDYTLPCFCLPLSQLCLLSSGKPATWDKQVG